MTPTRSRRPTSRVRSHTPADHHGGLTRRFIRLRLNLDKPADLRLSEAIDQCRGRMTVATFLREAIWWYVQTTPPGPADLRRDGWEIIDALARLVRQRQRGVRRRRLQTSLRGRRA